MISENPAKRLYDLIATFRTKGSKNPNVASIEVWKAVWNIDENNIFQKIIDLNTLITEIEKKLKCDPQVINKERHLSWVQPIRNTLNPTALMAASSNVVAGSYHPESIHMVTLEFCSEALSKSSGENKISDEEISTLLSDLDALIKDINNQIGDQTTRSLLLDLLASVEHGLRAFQIRGPGGIDESLNLALGKLHRYKAVLEENSKKEPTGILKRVVTFLQGTATVVDNAKKVTDGIALAHNAYEQLSSSLS